MRILAIHRYFWPDTPPYATFLRSIAGRWGEDGHQVEILTGRTTQSDRSWVTKRPANAGLGGIRVTRLRVFDEAGVLPGQLLNFVVFPARVALRILVGPRRDVVMCSTAPQVTLGFAVSLAAKARGSAFVYHCMDLHPEIGKLSGDFSNVLVYNLLRMMDVVAMRLSSKIVVLSEDMKASVIRRDPSLSGKLEVLNNFALSENAECANSPLPLPETGTLRMIFTGNLGRFQGLETAIEAIAALPDGNPVELVFMGAGKAKVGLEKLAADLVRRADSNVVFLPPGSAAEARALMRTAHFGLVSLAPSVVHYAYPSKTATYAAEGLPLLVVCDQTSDLSLSVQENCLGYAVLPGDAEAMASALVSARSQLAIDGGRELRESVAQFYRREFQEEAVLDRWSELVANGLLTDSDEKGSDVAIIVGAPRSGTNMLRDVLTSLDGFASWPCDEINLLWKHGNLDVPHDELTRSHARPDVVAFLRGEFQKLGRRYGAHTVVEKTCATSLRVGFAAEVFPEAKFIFIRRDGVDAAPSAMKRWNAPFDPVYTLRKVRWVPVVDLPRHLFAFGVKKARQKMFGDSGCESADVDVSTWWGPRPADFEQIQRHRPLDEIALIQWQRCVDSSMRDLDKLPSDRVLEVIYEDFVLDPVSGLRSILEFLGRAESMDAQAVENVTAKSVGKGREGLGPEAVRRLDSLSHETLRKLGYV